ncbi:MAG: cation-translocating P-type ATPase [Spirochaetales bacterium]|jgi:heavy metal translocating P-type ATPase|nr:cation-translocating P-type ATPase [Spirochaetales bacterium]
MMAFFKDSNRRTILFLCISAAALGVSFFGGPRFSWRRAGPITLDPAWAAILLCGAPIIKNAAAGLISQFDIKADLLVSLALIASIVIGELFAAGEVAFIMTIGAYLEERTVAKARAGIEKLVALTPAVARVIRSEGARLIPADEVVRGDILRVLAGETVPVDGVILKGQTAIDQSVMTGESLPVDKAEGDEVFSGTINQAGTFDMKAVKVGEDSSLQRMVRLVQSADAGKAKIVKTADKWATWIVVIALAAAAGTWFWTGQPIRSVTVLVVFCPCALVLATPTAIMAGIGNATKYGILVRQGDALERLATVQRIAFDKTGTLTCGKPTVVKIESCLPEISKDDLLSLAATAELRSEHPLGKALVNFYKNKEQGSPAEPEAFALFAGRGVQAEHKGDLLNAGNEALFLERGISLPPPLKEAAARAKQEGCTIIYLGINQRAAGFIALSDTLRPDAAGVVRAIHGGGTKTLLLTGDSPEAARHIAGAAGIDEVLSNCLPEDKITALKKYQAAGGGVCMVGDGVNDAPALKWATVGMAMGGIGSDIAIDAADIVLVRDDIKEIPHLLGLSRRTMRTININLGLSMILNFAAIALAITGLLNPVTGALVHNIGSVAVIIHSSLLLNWRKPEGMSHSKAA